MRASFVCSEIFCFSLLKMLRTVELSHDNLAYIIFMLFINIKLFIIDNYLSKGLPGQLHEALCKCIDMIFAYRVYVKVAQLVEYVTSNDRLFYLRESGVRVPMSTYIFSLVFCTFFV